LRGIKQRTGVAATAETPEADLRAGKTFHRQRALHVRKSPRRRP
jgi:hypothetical protein